jgi:hypothetical protein
MRVSAQILTLGGTPDGSPSLLVSTETGKYLIGAGEGLQRFAAEHRARLVRVDLILIPALTAAAVGGLPGLVLTLADMGRKSMGVVGGPRLGDFLLALRAFLRRSDVTMAATEIAAEGAAGASGAVEDSRNAVVGGGDGSPLGPPIVCAPILRADLSILPIPLRAAEEGDPAPAPAPAPAAAGSAGATAAQAEMLVEAALRALHRDETFTPFGGAALDAIARAAEAGAGGGGATLGAAETPTAR